MKHYGDIKQISGLTVPPVDVITGGSPCQDLSVAGKRAGLDGERSGLFMEQIRVIKEMRSKYARIAGSNQLVRLPRFAIWENVPGAFSSNKGKDFQAVLSEFVKGERWPKAGCLYDELGNWSIAWRLHDAQFWGVPQRRKRIALVADFGGLAAPEVLFERKGLSGDIEPSGAARERTAGATESSVASTITASYGTKWNGNAGAYSGGNFVIEPAGHGVEGAEYFGLDQQGGKGGANYTIGVAPTLAGDSHGTPHGVAYCLQGNTIDRDAHQNGSGISMDVSHTLNSTDRHGVYSIPEIANTLTRRYDGSPNPDKKQGANIVVAFKAGQGSKAGGIGAQEECSPTLSAAESGTNQVPAVFDARSNGDGETVPTITGDHENRVTDYTALCIGNGQMNQSVDDKAGALNCMHDQQAVMIMPFDTTQITSPQNGCHPHYGDPCHPLAAQAHVPSIVAAVDCRVNSVVRRLTSMECERLQGYPDGWTDIGEWVDSKGKRHKAADSPRYKALGNSIALPFWAWLARRICAQYERTATMASLFDGIGGFPLVFQRCGAIPVWASEIEEFPMAVTKLRFPE